MELLGNPASVNPKLEDVPRLVAESSGGYAATIMDPQHTKAEPEEPQKPVSCPCHCLCCCTAVVSVAWSDAECGVYHSRLCDQHQG